MTVRISLYRSQYLHVRANMISDYVEVMRQCIEVDLCPGGPVSDEFFMNVHAVIGLPVNHKIRAKRKPLRCLANPSVFFLSLWERVRERASVKRIIPDPLLSQSEKASQQLFQLN